MKRVLSLVLALVLVLGMIPTFAADMTAGQHLYEHEFIAGVGAGDLDEAGMLTREQLAKLILELNGKKEEAEALTLPPSFTDSAKISAWARPYVAYAQIEGLMVGFTDGSFRPQTGVSGQQLAQVLTRALGYEFSWATVVAEAADLGIEVATGAALTRGEAFEAMWTTVNTKPEGEETLTLGQLLGKLDPPAPPVAFAVESATATNLAEIVVKFNAAVDSTKVTVANFQVGGANAAAVSLSEDKMTVVVTPGTISAVNPKDYALVVKKAVGLAADYTATVTAFDTTLPVVTDVVLTGPTTFDIIFSEPVVVNTPSVLVNNGVYGASAAAPVGNKVTVTLGAALADGNYEVKVTGYKDHAGFPIATTTKTLAYAKDASALTASIVSAKQNEVTVKFSKKIATTLDVNHFYHTFSAWTPNAVATTDNQTYKLTFSTYTIPEGNFNLTVKATNGSVKVTDVWGIDLAANAVVTGSVTADKVAPTVVIKEVTSESALKVEFSEAVTGGATAANYTVRKADGTALTGITATLDTGNVYIVNFGAVQAAGTYTLEVKGVTDTALAPNTMQPVVLTFNVTDKTAPTAPTLTYVDTAADLDEVVYLAFNESMATTGAGSVLDVNNYRLGAVKPKAVTAFGTNKFKLTFADGTSLADGQVFTYGQLADAAGNQMAALTGTITLAAVTHAEAAVVAGDITITTTSLNTVKIVINKVIPTLTASDISVTNGATADLAIISLSNDGTKTTIVGTLNATTALADTASKPTSITFKQDKLVTDTGVKNGADITILAAAMVDGIAPSYASIAQVDNDQFTITLNENLKGGLSLPLVATDLVVKKANGTQLVAGIGYNVTYATNVITVTLTTPLTANETLSIASVATPQYIVDAADNKVNAFTGKSIAMDLTAPVLTAVSHAATAATTANLLFTTDSAGTYYYLVYAAGDAAPNAATVIAQGASVAKGTAAATAGANTVAVTGLTTATAYKAYVVVVDVFGNISAVSATASVTQP